MQRCHASPVTNELLLEAFLGTEQFLLQWGNEGKPLPSQSHRNKHARSRNLKMITCQANIVSVMKRKAHQHKHCYGTALSPQVLKGPTPPKTKKKQGAKQFWFFVSRPNFSNPLQLSSDTTKNLQKEGEGQGCVCICTVSIFTAAFQLMSTNVLYLRQLPLQFRVAVQCSLELLCCLSKCLHLATRHTKPEQQFSSQQY